MLIFRHRRGLKRTLKAVSGGTLRVGFIGGSITEEVGLHNWPEPLLAWFIENFPNVRLIVENAALAGTGSDLACFRAQRDLIERGCDLVFVDFAVDDAGVAMERRRRTQEGLLRQLLAGAGRDVLLTYGYSPDMFQSISRGTLPPTIRELEELGEHYGLGSVWMGLHAMREVEAGRMRWEEWLPDGLHPQVRGSLSYAQSVTSFLKRELLTQPSLDEISCGDNRPRPINQRCWENVSSMPLELVTTKGPWTLRRSRHWWANQILDTAAPGAQLNFSFNGRGVALGFDFGRTSSEFRYRIDGNEWIAVTRERLAGCGDSGWFRLETLSDYLPAGTHNVVVEVIHGNRPDCTGTNFRLALMGVIQ